MRTKKFFLCALVALVPIVMISCDKTKDDNNSSTAVDVSKIEGTYEGYTLAASAYFQNNFTADEQVTVAKVSDNTVDVVLASGTWGTSTIGGATVIANGNRYTVSGNGSCTMAGMGGAERTYDCSLSADIANTASATITISIPAVMGGTNVVFKTGRASTGYYVAGKYRGDIAVAVSGTTYATIADTVIALKAEEGDKAGIIIPEACLEMGARTLTLPSKTFEGISVTTSDYSTFTIPEQQLSFSFEGTSYSGTISGGVANGVLSLTYKITPGSMPMPITFTFTQSVSK